MKEIAQKAGMANSMLTYHFKKKENLWKQSVAQLGKKLQERFIQIDSVLIDVEGMAALKAYTRQFIYFSAEYPEFYKIVFHEMCTKTARADWIIETVLAPLHRFFKKNSNAENGEKSTMGGFPIANMLSITVGAANVFFIHNYHLEKMYGVNPFDKEEIVKHADIVIELLFKNLDDIKG